MSYFEPFEKVLEKMLDKLAEYGLVATWQHQKFPLTLVVSPNASPESQVNLLGADSEGAMSPDARLRYIFGVDHVDVQMDGRISLPDSVINEIKSCAKKMHYLWLQGYHANIKIGVTDPQAFEFDESSERSTHDETFTEFFDETPEKK